MIPYCVQTKDINQDHLDLLNYVRDILPTLSNNLTCHSVCEVIISVIEGNSWQHIRGKFNGFDHSWLYNESACIILDPYPWACGSGPILIYIGGPLNPWKAIYVDIHESDYVNFAYNENPIIFAIDKE